MKKWNIRVGRIVIFNVILICIFFFIYWDKNRINNDFSNTIKLLKDTRFTAIHNNQLMIVRFYKKKLIIEDKLRATVNYLSVPTLYRVNYDTTLGNNMIVFNGHGTSTYNIRIHGGDLTLKSWLGFKKHIHVNCTGLVKEGLYPTEK